MSKRFDCPKCGEKRAAIQSSTYPDIIVHKCYGQVMNEVASYKNQIFSKLEDNSPFEVISKNFKISQLKDIHEAYEVSTRLELGFSEKSLNDWCFANSLNKFLVVKLAKTEIKTHLIFLSDRKLIGSSCFLSFNKRLPNIRDAYEVLEAITGPFLDKNPYNELFKP